MPERSLKEVVAKICCGVAYGRQVPHRLLVKHDEAVEIFKAADIAPELLAASHAVYMSKLKKKYGDEAPANVHATTLASKLDGVRTEALQLCLKTRYTEWYCEHTEHPAHQLKGRWLVFLETEKPRLPSWLKATAEQAASVMRAKLTDEDREDAEAMISKMDAQMELPL